MSRAVSRSVSRHWLVVTVPIALLRSPPCTLRRRILRPTAPRCMAQGRYAEARARSSKPRDPQKPARSEARYQLGVLYRTIGEEHARAGPSGTASTTTTSAVASTRRAPASSRTSRGLRSCSADGRTPTRPTARPSTPMSTARTARARTSRGRGCSSTSTTPVTPRSVSRTR